jgi:hypothetical protein
LLPTIFLNIPNIDSPFLGFCRGHYITPPSA